jgi:uncharacterized protein with FMN-binding domain
MDTKKALVAIVVVAILGFAGMQLMNKDTSSENTMIEEQAQDSVTSTSGTDTITQVVTPEAATSSYKNGTYSATGNYQSPAGQEEIVVTITLKDGTIADSEFESKAVNTTSKKMQGLFATGYKTMVVGKALDEVTLDVVNGSSLTPKGFEDALQKIKTEASAS